MNAYNTAIGISSNPIQSQTQPFDTEATRIIKLANASAENIYKDLSLIFKLTAVVGASQAVSVGLVERRLDPATNAELWVPIPSNVTVQAGSTVTVLPEGQTAVTVPAGEVARGVSRALVRVVGDIVVLNPVVPPSGAVAIRVNGSVTTSGALATYVGQVKIGQLGLS
jgi:hypothetical protein